MPSNYYDADEVAIPPIKGWGVIKSNDIYRFWHILEHPAHDGLTWTGPYNEQICRMCNISMPSDIKYRLRQMCLFIFNRKIYVS